jgi:hypothetical protein
MTDHLDKPVFKAGLNSEGPLDVDAGLNLNGPAGVGRSMTFQAGWATRWAMGRNGTAETGSNVGSDFSIGRYSDAGSWVADAITIQRSTGQIYVAKPIVMNDPIPTQNDHTASKQYVDGAGGYINVTGSVSSNISTTTVVNTLVGSSTLWGGVGYNAGGLVAQDAGLYKVTMHGAFSSNNTGTIRMAGVFLSGQVLPSPGNAIGNYASGGANTSGWGAVISATGYWQLNAGAIMYVYARQDCGSALTLNASLTLEKIR